MEKKHPHLKCKNLGTQTSPADFDSVRMQSGTAAAPRSPSRTPRLRGGGKPVAWDLAISILTLFKMV